MQTKITLLLALALMTGCATQQKNLQNDSANTDSLFPMEQGSQLDVTLSELEKIGPADQEGDEFDFWQRLTDQFALTGDFSSEGIDPYTDWLSDNQKYIDRITTRGNRYLYFILEQTEQRGMPAEIALLPAVESAFNPQAYSRSHAAGLWQFIPSTARHYGLKSNWWKDERRDVLASTEAALDYLQYLNKLFDGDWLLAIAAYNCGEGTVAKAIKRNELMGKPTDFWSLKLPRETRAYVPRLLALAKVVQSPEEFGIQLHEIPDQPYFDVVELPGQISLHVAAELADVDYGLLRALNPAYKQSVTAPSGPHRLLLPIESSDVFKSALASTPLSEWKPAEIYSVKKGDSLYKIAKNYKLPIEELYRYNRLSSDRLKIGQQLEIPGTGISQLDNSGETLTYRVQNGDSLWSIAKRHGVTVSRLVSANKIQNPSSLKPGQVLIIEGKLSGQAQELKKMTYQVRRGDSLSHIAKRFYLSINDILSWNEISQSALLHPGQKLTLYVDTSKI